MRPAFVLVVIAVLASIACGSVIARKYEYEEEIFLSLDGSATVYVNASVPALVSLRGLSLPLAVKRGYHRHFRATGNAGLSRPILDAEVGYLVTPMEQGIRLTSSCANRLAELVLAVTSQIAILRPRKRRRLAKLANVIHADAQVNVAASLPA